MEQRNSFDAFVLKGSAILAKISPNIRAWLPSRGNVVFTLLVVLVLAWTQSAGAFNGGQGPAAEPSGSVGLIAYQGRLADSGGNPLTGMYTMVFRLYSQASGGVPLWEEQRTGPNSVSISDGLFSVMLGSITPVPQSLVESNTNLYLGITVGTDDEMQPRVQVGTVMYARQALTVPDGAVTSAKIASGAVNTGTIADSAVTSAKIANGAVSTDKIADGSISLAKIVDGSITSIKIADESITSADIANGTIGTADVANGAITAAKLGSDVSNVFVQGGRREVTEYTSGYGLHTGSGERYFVEWVPFSQSFSATPNVLVSLSKFNLLGTKNTCLDVYPQNISSTGFELVYHTWWDCTVYLVAATWVAYGTK